MTAHLREQWRIAATETDPALVDLAFGLITINEIIPLPFDDLDPSDPDDRVIYRMKVERLFQNLSVSGIAQWATQLGNPPKGRDRSSAIKALADAWMGVGKTAGSSWRPFSDGMPWLEHDAVIMSDGGPSGRKDYEVYDGGRLVASRHSLAEAKKVIADRWGEEPQWHTLRHDKTEVTHYYFGPTTEFSSPTTTWAADR